MVNQLLQACRPPPRGATTANECVDILASPPDHYATPGPGG
jgi:hypothetical protein